MEQKRQIILGDGGNGHLLRKYGVKIEGEVGSKQRFLNVSLCNVTQPEMIRKMHKEFIDAGAQLITTNSYACVPGFGIDDGELKKYIQAAGQIAKQVTKDSNVRVGGTIPPLYDSYKAENSMTESQMKQSYKFICDTIGPYSDIFYIATMSSIRDAKISSEVASEYGKPIWLNFSLSDKCDGTLRSGESLKDALE